MAAPLTATFLGMLVVHALGFADDAAAAEVGGNGSAPTSLDSPQPQGAEAGAASTGMHNILMAGGAAHVAAGSIISVGNIIDLGALSLLSGGARFADGDMRDWGDTAAPHAPMPAAVADTATGEDVPLGAPSLTTVALQWPQEPGAAGLTPGDVAPPIGNVDTGTDGDDVLTGTDDSDHLEGGAGNDQISGGAGDDILQGGAGDDTIAGDAGDDTIDGGSGDDILAGGTGNDNLEGGAGDDQLDGGDGSDQVAGGTGNDVVDGGYGADWLDGEEGNDIIVVDSWRDVATEGTWRAGIDTIKIGDGYAASVAKDLGLYSHDGHATFVIGGQIGTGLPDGFDGFRQQVHGGFENVWLEDDGAHNVLGDDRDNTIWGNDFANHLAGGGGADRIYGTGGDDVILGGQGDDELWGGDGLDVLDGGEGSDLLYGGEGDDVFVLGLSESPPDRIFDHEGVNLLRLEGVQADKVAAHLVDEDLVLSHDGTDVAVIDHYVGHEQAYAGIDLGNGVQALGGFLQSGTSQAPHDILAADLGAPQQAKPDILADFSGEDAQPAAAAAPGEQALTLLSDIANAPVADIGQLPTFYTDEIWVSGDSGPVEVSQGANAFEIAARHGTARRTWPRLEYAL